MDLGCLATLGALLLIAGLVILLFERFRRSRAGTPYPFPDRTTALIEEDPDATPIQPRSAFPRFVPNATRAKQGTTWLASRLRSVGTHQRSMTPASNGAKQRPTLPSVGRGALVTGILSATLLTLVVVAALGATSAPQSPQQAVIVVGLAGFEDTNPSTSLKESLANDLREALRAGGSGDVAIRLSVLAPGTEADAEAERRGLGADFLVWGDIGPSGAVTASLLFAPNFAVGQQRWQRYTEVDTGALLFPAMTRVYLAPGAGVDPLVPLMVALVHLRAGEYQAAARAAMGAQATLDGGNGSGEIGRFVEAAAYIAAGQAGKSVPIHDYMERSGAAWPEVAVNQSIAFLRLGDWANARTSAETALNNRDSTDVVLARANLVRARARYRAGAEFTQAISDLDEALRLDPGYPLARLDKAEVLYRQSQPDLARVEIESLLARLPDLAPAYRLMGLVRLMLAQPDDAQGALGNAARHYSDWIATLRAEESRAQLAGDATEAEIATEGILTLNRELAGVYLYQGMALADKARTEPPESFLGGAWRNIRGEKTLSERAIEKMQEAARLDPRRADIAVQMGNVYLQMGDTGRGAQALAAAREIDPSAPEPYLALARLQEAQRNIPEAIKTITELTTNAQGYYPAYEELYRLHVTAGDQQSANAALQRALDFAPQTPLDHLWRGKFLRLLDNRAQAEIEFRAALTDPDLWEARVNLGELLEQASRRPEALVEFREALAIQPNDPRALLGAAKLLAMAGQVAEAEALFGRLNAVAPQNTDGHIAYSQLLFGKGDIEGAIDQAKQAVAADPARDDAHFFLGLALEANQDWPAAIEQFRATVERNPSNFEALVRLSRVLYMDDRYSDVLAVAESAIALRGDDPQPYRWKASAQLELGDPTGAIDSLRKSLQINAQYVEALAVASEVYASQGNVRAALDLAERATQADPANPSGPLATGGALLRQPDAAAALQAFDTALSTGLQRPAALVGKGRAYLLAGDYDSALKLFGEATMLEAGFATAYLYTGDTHAAIGNWDEALRNYSRAVELRPRWAQALYRQGKALLLRGNTDGALQAFDRTLAAVPNFADAWAGRGTAYRNRGQHREALAALRRAIEIKPDYAEAWLSIGLTYEELGNRADALQAFTNASNTATTPSTKQQAESGLKRVK